MVRPQKKTTTREIIGSTIYNNGYVAYRVRCNEKEEWITEYSFSDKENDMLLKFKTDIDGLDEPPTRLVSKKPREVKILVDVVEIVNHRTLDDYAMCLCRLEGYNSPYRYVEIWGTELEQRWPSVLSEYWNSNPGFNKNTGRRINGREHRGSEVELADVESIAWRLQLDGTRDQTKYDSIDESRKKLPALRRRIAPGCQAPATPTAASVSTQSIQHRSVAPASAASSSTITRSKAAKLALQPDLSQNTSSSNPASSAVIRPSTDLPSAGSVATSTPSRKRTLPPSAEAPSARRPVIRRVRFLLPSPSQKTQTSVSPPVTPARDENSDAVSAEDCNSLARHASSLPRHLAMTAVSNSKELTTSSAFQPLNNNVPSPAAANVSAANQKSNYYALRPRQKLIVASSRQIMPSALSAYQQPSSSKTLADEDLPATVSAQDGSPATNPTTSSLRQRTMTAASNRNMQTTSGSVQQIPSSSTPANAKSLATVAAQNQTSSSRHMLPRSQLTSSAKASTRKPEDSAVAATSPIQTRNLSEKRSVVNELGRVSGSAVKTPSSGLQPLPESAKLNDREGNARIQMYKHFVRKLPSRKYKRDVHGLPDELETGIVSEYMEMKFYERCVSLCNEYRRADPSGLEYKLIVDRAKDLQEEWSRKLYAVTRALQLRQEQMMSTSDKTLN